MVAAVHVVECGVRWMPLVAAGVAAGLVARVGGMGRWHVHECGSRGLPHLVPFVVDALIISLFPLQLLQLLHRHIILPIVTAPRHGAPVTGTKMSLAFCPSLTLSQSKRACQAPRAHSAAQPLVTSALGTRCRAEWGRRSN